MSLPKDLKNLRACKVCCLVKTFEQFQSEGCDNCDRLDLRSNTDYAHDCTSANFDGLIALMDPNDSWVAKWQGISSCKSGMYAVSVSGDLPAAIVRQLREKNIYYKSRDVGKKN